MQLSGRTQVSYIQGSEFNSQYQQKNFKQKKGKKLFESKPINGVKVRVLTELGSMLLSHNIYSYLSFISQY